MSTTPERPDSEDTTSQSDAPSLSPEQTHEQSGDQSHEQFGDQSHEQSGDQSHEQFAPPPPPPPTTFATESTTDTSNTVNPLDTADTPPPPPPATQPAPQSAPPTYPPPAPSGTGGDYGPPAGSGSAPAYSAPAGTVAPLNPQEEKGWSLAAHLLVLVGGFVAPLIIWLVFKGRGPFLEHHAKESLNFQITVMIAMFAAIILMFLLVGFVLILALIPWMVVMPILAAIKANNGEWYRYPLTLRLVK